MGIQSGKISIIYDNDPRLAAVWKGKIGEITERPDPSSGNGGGGNDAPEINRPQRSDIVLKDFIKYEELGVEKRKAVFRIYNSSKEPISGFSFALTLPDQAGGRA